MKRDCKKVVCCKDCNSQYHPTALHVNNSTVKSTVSQQHQPITPVNNSYSVKTLTVSSNYGGRNTVELITVAPPYVVNLLENHVLK